MTEHWQTCLGCARVKIRELQSKLIDYEESKQDRVRLNNEVIALGKRLVDVKEPLYKQILALEKDQKTSNGIRNDQAHTIIDLQDKLTRCNHAYECMKESMQKGIDQCHKEIRVLKDLNDLLVAEKKVLEGKLKEPCDAITDELHTMATDITEKNKTIIELHGTIKELKDTVEHLKERKAHYKTMAQAEGITNDGADRIIELTKENNLLTADVERLQSEIKQGHDRWLETVKANASLGTLAVNLGGEIDTLKQDLAAVRGDCEAFEENFDAIGKKIEALESTIKTAQAEKRI